MQSTVGPTLAPQTAFALIGAGRVGITLGVLLRRAGHVIVGASGRSGSSLERAADYIGCPSSTSFLDVIEDAEAILIAVPDDSVEPVSSALTEAGLKEGTVVLHAAGSIGLGPLRPLEEAGAHILAAHVLQSVPNVDAGIERVPGSWFGVTCGDDMRGWASDFVEAVGGKVLWVDEDARDLYHAGAVIASNYLTVLGSLIESTGMEVAPYLPLMSGSIANIETLGSDAALTGPIVRGDIGTIKRHLSRLGAFPEVESAYRTLGLVALGIAESRSTITSATASAIRELLEPSP